MRKKFRTRDEKQKPIVEDHCPLSVKFGGLANSKRKLKTQNSYAFLYSNFSITFLDMIAICFWEIDQHGK